MSSHSSLYFVGIVFAICLYARWAHRATNRHPQPFPAEHVLLALVVIAIGLAFTYGAVDMGKLAPNLQRFMGALGGQP